MRVFGIIVKSTTLGQHGFELCQCMYACSFPVNIELAFYSLRFPISSFNKQQIRMFICCWQNPWKWDLGYRGPTMGLKHHWILVYSGAPVQGILKILLPQHSSKVSILQHSAFFMIQLSHPCMTTGKTIALTWWTFVSNVMSLLLLLCYDHNSYSYKSLDDIDLLIPMFSSFYLLIIMLNLVAGHLKPCLFSGFFYSSENCLLSL